MVASLFCRMNKKPLKLLQGVLHDEQMSCTKAMKLLQGVLHRVQFSHEVTSSRFCNMYNLAMKLLQVDFCIMNNLAMKLLQIDFATCTI